MREDLSREGESACSGLVMGAYIYQVYGKEFPIRHGGEVLSAKRLKFLEKPFSDAFYRSEERRVPSYLDDFTKRQIRRYLMLRGRWEKMDGARILVFPPTHDKEGSLFRIVPDLRCLLFPHPKVWLWDDPNWEGGVRANLRASGAGLEAVLT